MLHQNITPFVVTKKYSACVKRITLHHVHNEYISGAHNNTKIMEKIKSTDTINSVARPTAS
jgi:hypothetical protein